jgi:hypothetical protein
MLRAIHAPAALRSPCIGLGISQSSQKENVCGGGTDDSQGASKSGRDGEKVSDPKQTPFDDPNVKEALRDGRDSSDIHLIGCYVCGEYSYYNDGSHFTCRFCDWTLRGRKLDAVIEDGGAISLDGWSEMAAGDNGP